MGTVINPQTIIDAARRDRAGFLGPRDIQALGSHPFARLWPVLVRCGGGRFTCPVQDVEHFVQVVGASGLDSVRDVALVAGQVYQ